LFKRRKKLTWKNWLVELLQALEKVDVAVVSSFTQESRLPVN
jgi:hypothetical protein